MLALRQPGIPIASRCLGLRSNGEGTHRQAASSYACHRHRSKADWGLARSAYSKSERPRQPGRRLPAPLVNFTSLGVIKCGQEAAAAVAVPALHSRASACHWRVPAMGTCSELRYIYFLHKTGVPGPWFGSLGIFCSELTCPRMAYSHACVPLADASHWRPFWGPNPGPCIL